jgi:hypothetical protein
MSSGSYDKSKEIAAILCPHLRDKSPKTPFRVLAGDDDELFASVYRDLQRAGGRKALFESRNHFVMTALLHNEVWFHVGRAIIELRSGEPNSGFWTGAGEFKTTSAEVGAELGRMFEAAGYGSPTGPDGLFQIDITRVWGELSHLLEDRDPAERESEQRRQQLAALEAIPNYEGSPADPKTAAEIDAMLADVRGETKRDPPRHISREQALAVFHQRYRPSLVRLFEITDTLPQDFCHLPGDCDFYGSFANCWFVQFALTYDDPCLVADRLVVVSKSSGEIVYDDSANDEG